jgi:hypothetical protein
VQVKVVLVVLLPLRFRWILNDCLLAVNTILLELRTRKWVLV